MWRTHSISFVIVILFLGLLIGSVLGSLLSQIFGLAFLNYGLFQIELIDFYLVKKLQLSPTAGSFIGLLAAGWVLYKRLQTHPS